MDNDRGATASNNANFAYAKQFLQTGSDFSLAEVAAHAGFSDQSQFSYHFKRVLGVTPGQFRMSAGNA